MMEEYRDEYVKVCPWCGGSEMIEAYQSAYGALTAKGNPFGGCALYHAVCRKCGSSFFVLLWSDRGLTIIRYLFSASSLAHASMMSFAVLVSSANVTLYTCSLSPQT